MNAIIVMLDLNSWLELCDCLPPLSLTRNLHKDDVQVDLVYLKTTVLELFFKSTFMQNAISF
jgi:hypothetical protein